jgi:hypothetical protein
MNVDLLFTARGEAGLIANENLLKKVAGVLMDTQTGLLTLEYVDMDYLEMNIPLDPEFFAALDQTAQLHIGAVKAGNIAQAYQIPLLFQDDPYRGDLLGRAQQAQSPLVEFDYFIKACVRGQPVHREDLGNESAMGCVLGDAVPSSLQFAPHLARRHAMEAAPKAAPSGPGPSVPGLGGGGGGGSVYRGNRSQNGGKSNKSNGIDD